MSWCRRRRLARGKRRPPPCRRRHRSPCPPCLNPPGRLCPPKICQLRSGRPSETLPRHQGAPSRPQRHQPQPEPRPSRAPYTLLRPGMPSQHPWPRSREVLSVWRHDLRARNNRTSMASDNFCCQPLIPHIQAHLRRRLRKSQIRCRSRPLKNPILRINR